MNQKNLISKACREAVNEVHSGDTIWIGDTRGSAAEFLEELAARVGQFKDITVIAATGSAETPCAKMLRETENIRFLSFSPEAILQTYRTFGQRFITADNEKISALVCENFGVNIVVLPVCTPDEYGVCALTGNMVPFESYVSDYPGVLKHIALIDPHAAPTYGANWTQMNRALFFSFYGDAHGHDLLRL